MFAIFNRCIDVLCLRLHLSLAHAGVCASLYIWLQMHAYIKQRKMSFTETNKMYCKHYRHLSLKSFCSCPQPPHSAFRIRQLDTKECENLTSLAMKQTNLQGHLKTISGQSLQTFFSLKAISQPSTCELMQDSCPVVSYVLLRLCLSALAHSHQPQGLGEECPTPLASSFLQHDCAAWYRGLAQGNI